MREKSARILSTELIPASLMREKGSAIGESENIPTMLGHMPIQPAIRRERK